jgi:hypothetical protein
VRAALVLLAVLVPLEAWRECLLRGQLAEPDAGLALTPAVRVAIGLAALAALLAAEALVYGMLWSLRGARLPLARAWLALLQVSMLEPLALELVARAGGHPDAVTVALVGARALAPAAGAGAFATAFGSAGLLALARVALAALAQARLAGRPWREAVALVTAGWLASHVAIVWLLDLVWGRSGR